jgi:hypothetical protein
MIEIGSLRFPSKVAAIKHFREILYRYPFGARIPDPDATELAWLLECHPEYEEKLGSGIDHFFVGEAIYNTRCFHASYVDGTFDDFSIRACINGEG